MPIPESATNVPRLARVVPIGSAKLRDFTPDATEGGLLPVVFVLLSGALLVIYNVQRYCTVLRTVLALRSAWVLDGCTWQSSSDAYKASSRRRATDSSRSCSGQKQDYRFAKTALIYK